MKLPVTSPLQVSLHFDDELIVPVGRLAYRDRKAYLEYDAEFRESELRLSPVHHRTVSGLELPYDPSAFDGLHGVFADSIPDGWGRLLVDQNAERRGIPPSELTPIDRLAIVGDKGIGALTYQPETGKSTETSGAVDLDEIAASAHTVLTGEECDAIEWLGSIGGSPNGARPKALVWLDNNGRAIHGLQGATEGFEPYLVKFRALGDEHDIGAIEHAYALMARHAGIDISQTRLLEGQSGNRYFATRRFDLQDGGRIHVHSASGMLYADPTSSKIDYIDLLKLTYFVTRDVREVLKTFRLAVFNVLSYNRDDHAKQFSYTMDREGVWRFAPAYDLTFSHGVGGEHFTAVCGYGKEIKREQLLQLAKKTQISARQASEIIEEVRDTVASWGKFAEQANVSKRSTAKVARFIDKIGL